MHDTIIQYYNKHIDIRYRPNKKMCCYLKVGSEVPESKPVKLDTSRTVILPPPSECSLDEGMNLFDLRQLVISNCWLVLRPHFRHVSVWIPSTEVLAENKRERYKSRFTAIFISITMWVAYLPRYYIRT